MSADSPVIIPFNTDGVELPLKDGATLPTDIAGLMIVGKDGTVARFIAVDSDGKLALQSLPAGTNNIGDVDVLSVPAPLSTTGGGAEATALRVTLANDSTGLVSVDDNGGNLSIDWIGSTAPTVGQKSMANSIPVVIANDQTSISTGIQNEVDAEKVFSIATELNMATASTDNPLIMLRNPIGSGKTMYLLKVQDGTSVTNVGVVFKTYHTPTITANGTVITPENRKIGAATASVILATTLPTLSSLGTKVSSLVHGQNNNSVVFDENYTIAVPAGKTLVFTGSPTSNNRQAVITIVWVEK